MSLGCSELYRALNNRRRDSGLSDNPQRLSVSVKVKIRDAASPSLDGGGIRRFETSRESESIDDAARGDTMHLGLEFLIVTLRAR